MPADVCVSSSVAFILHVSVLACICVILMPHSQFYVTKRTNKNLRKETKTQAGNSVMCKCIMKVKIYATFFKNPYMYLTCGLYFGKTNLDDKD